MQSSSLWSALTGDDDLSRHRQDVYSEYYNSSIMLAEADTRVYLTMLRTDRCTIAAVHGRDEGELCDLQEGPGEQQNLWRETSVQTLALEMLTRLTDRVAFASDPLPARDVRG